LKEAAVKVTCPHCSRPLNLPDRFAGKNAKCPACQQSFDCPELPPDPKAKPAKTAAPAKAPAAAAAAPAPAMAAHVSQGDPDDELALIDHGDPHEHDLPPDPTTVEICPGCGAKWKKDARQCKKCNYNIIAGAKIKPPVKRRVKLNIDAQKVFLYMAIVGAAYGGYWLYHGGWRQISGKVNKEFDDAARGHVSADDDAAMTRNASRRKEDDKK
jgi:hypothetical protein